MTVPFFIFMLVTQTAPRTDIAIPGAAVRCAQAWLDSERKNYPVLKGARLGQPYASFGNR
jgi:hypothetical protein